MFRILRKLSMQQRFFSSVGSDFKRKVNLTSGQFGDNILHHALRHVKQEDDIDGFKEILNDIDTKQASTLSRQTNDQGQIPYDLAIKKFLRPEIDWKLRSALLIPMLLQENIKKLNEKLTEPTLLSPSDTVLQTHLKTGRLVVNEVRSIMKQSSNHPHLDLNLDKTDLKKEIGKKIKEVRKQTKNLLPMKPQQWLRKVALMSIDAQVGNCEEFSYVALYKLNEMNPKLSGEIYRISNGDHCFLVIGREKGSDRYDWHTWGDQAVICDAWFGDVFSAKEIPSRLIDATEYGGSSSSLCFVTPFNPKYHRLKPLTEIVEGCSTDISIEKMWTKVGSLIRKQHGLFDSCKRTEKDNHTMVKSFRFS